MVELVRNDLEFILRQIKIAEAHSGGTPLTAIRVDAQGNVVTDSGAPSTPAIPANLSPYGLRTIDGSYNNLVEGREQWGAADNPFPRITQPDYRNEGDDAMPPGYVPGNNNDYGTPGNVVDADPRIISNLIVDQTLENPAAIYAALTHTGVTGAALTQALNEIRAAYAAVKAATTEEARASAQAALNASLGEHGVEMDGKSVIIPNVAPDEGLSAPYNGWFTLFGQFFDHGLDLVNKNGGTVFIPLAADDPLYNPASPQTNFMALTRTTGNGENTVTPWVDQNQTYTSHASHQMFLREYAMVDGKPLATGKLLEGDRGLATWADVKQQAREMLGIDLTDADLGNIPLFAVDQYGEFIRGPNGFPQLVVGLGADGKFGGGDDVLVEGNPAAPVNPAAVGAFRTGHAFLDDIAHAAKTVNDRGQKMYADHDDAPGLGVTLIDNPNYDPLLPVSSANPLKVGVNPEFNPNQPVSATNPQYLSASRFYDDELLDAHYVTGDGRGNENIGLSAVHHIFHSEHNRTVEQVKVRAVESGDLAFLNEWLLVDLPAGAALPPAGDAEAIKAFAATLSWDGERLFQAARFTTEMQYQHLVFEEFARKVQPDVDAFVFNPSVDINPAIFAEFAHVVYRFGHSMLNQQVAATGADGSDQGMDLFQAFLNPLAFGSGTVSHEVAAGAIIRGMTSQVGNEIDEFVTDVLRNQLVGIPLDLAALNIARGRETGIPSLNEARAQFKSAANGDTQLDPYTSWLDFALNLKNPASIVNFVAAYGTHATITGAATVEAKREAAMKLVFGDPSLNEADRQAFLNGTGLYADKLGGLDDVDLWVGGLAEKKMAFGGMLGSTFSFIFELQLENLQNADRFYYLSRVQGLNLLNELENNSLAKMVLNNTDLGETGYALPGDIFSVPDHVVYLDRAQQARFGHVDPQHDNPFLEAVSKMVERRDTNGDGVDEYVRINSNDHFLIQGTDGDDHIIAGGGDDSVWARKGNDRIEAGYGVDKIHGGQGDDIITNSGTDIGETDMLHGEEGNDAIHGGSGLALIFGNQGHDYIVTGPDGKEAFGGTGNDFILGGEGADFLLGNEGDDWIEGGGGFDGIAGDNSELLFNSPIIGHDVMFAGADEQDFDAESGDDIMVQGESVMRNEGMFGFDWAIHKGNREAADSDLLTRIFTTDEADILRDRFDQVEALSGWEKNDVLRGDNRTNVGPGDGEVDPDTGLVEGRLDNNELSHAGVDRIAGLRALLGDMIAAAPTAPGADLERAVAFDAGNILLGGGGSDTIEGRGGNDLIDGDAWLNVRIRVRDASGNEIGSAEGMTGAVIGSGGTALYGGKSLTALIFDRTINPGQISIAREILKDDGADDTDVAVFRGNRSEYTITSLGDGSFRVVHANPVQPGSVFDDGTDTLRNVERARFADQTVILNTPASGSPIISDATPTEGQALTASVAGISDVDGLPPLSGFRYQWQSLNGATWTDIAGATGASFTPLQAQVNHQLRAVVRFTDGGATTETLISAATAVVGDLFNGGVGNDNPTLTAGADKAFGDGGADTLLGGAGDDTLDGG
ncbi:peroxidase family protein, partial [Craurococcus roseus]|uniref:peroxidase family protein n=1 Tax=Craurococcus roseus TaxID=77585 RepID=UPI0031DFE847